MTKVSGLADPSTKFASFLTIARKFNYNCVCAFHVIYPEKAIWRSIISQTNVFNVFPASVSLNSVRRILESFCVRKTGKYIPQSTLWISRLLIKLTNKNETVRLTLNCSGINISEPGKFRTDADKLDYQTGYFNTLNNEQLYNEHISEQKNNSEDKENIQFKIIQLKSKMNKDKTFDATEELCPLMKNGLSTNRTNEKRRAGDVFSISNKQFASGIKSVCKTRARPKFWL